MPPSVRTVTDLRPLGLRRVAGPEGRDRPVRWVAVSELEDPRPFLEGGELLLTTGMRLAADQPEALDAYVARLVEVGVAALGLGVGLTHPTCPPALVDAADAYGLPLLEVPDSTAFIAISKAVSALLGAEEYEAIRRAFEAQRDLTRAALAADGPGAVTSRVAKHIGGWALLLDATGSVVHAAPASAAARAETLSGEVQALRARGLLASSSLGDAAGQVSIQPLGASGKVRGFLAVGTSEPLDRTAQSVVAVAVSLLSIAVERDGPAEQTRREVAAAALILLVSGTDPHALPLALLGWGWLSTGPLRLLVVHASDGRESDATRFATALESRLEPTATVVAATDQPLVLIRDDEATVALVDDVLADFPGLQVGGSASFPLPAIEAAARQARLAAAGARGEQVRWYGQLASSGMLSAVDPVAAAGVADALLAPLRGRKGDLVESLAAWLARHGQWDAAAADLGVHRHTLRYRMQRVEELLGRSLDDADLRAELWLALRVSR